MKKYLMILMIICSLFVVQNAYAIDETTNSNTASNAIFANTTTASTNSVYNNVTNTQPIQCSNLIIKDIEGILTIFKIVAPIVVVIFSTYDFIKTAVSNVEDNGKAAFIRFLKRLMYAFLFFITPNLIIFLISLLDPSYAACINHP